MNTEDELYSRLKQKVGAASYEKDAKRMYRLY